MFSNLKTLVKSAFELLDEDDILGERNGAGGVARQPIRDPFNTIKQPDDYNKSGLHVDLNKSVRSMNNSPHTVSASSTNSSKSTSSISIQNQILPLPSSSRDAHLADPPRQTDNDIIDLSHLSITERAQIEVVLQRAKNEDTNSNKSSLQNVHTASPKVNQRNGETGGQKPTAAPVRKMPAHPLGEQPSSVSQSEFYEYSESSKGVPVLQARSSTGAIHATTVQGCNSNSVTSSPSLSSFSSTASSSSSNSHSATIQQTGYSAVATTVVVQPTPNSPPTCSVNRFDAFFTPAQFAPCESIVEAEMTPSPHRAECISCGSFIFKSDSDPNMPRNNKCTNCSNVKISIIEAPHKVEEEHQNPDAALNQDLGNNKEYANNPLDTDKKPMQLQIPRKHMKLPSISCDLVDDYGIATAALRTKKLSLPDNELCKEKESLHDIMNQSRRDMVSSSTTLSVDVPLGTNGLAELNAKMILERKKKKRKLPDTPSQNDGSLDASPYSSNLSIAANINSNAQEPIKNEFAAREINQAKSAVPDKHVTEWLNNSFDQSNATLLNVVPSDNIEGGMSHVGAKSKSTQFLNILDKPTRRNSVTTVIHTHDEPLVEINLSRHFYTEKRKLQMANSMPTPPTCSIDETRHDDQVSPMQQLHLHPHPQIKTHLHAHSNCLSVDESYAYGPQHLRPRQTSAANIYVHEHSDSEDSDVLQLKRINLYKDPRQMARTASVDPASMTRRRSSVTSLGLEVEAQAPVFYLGENTTAAVVRAIEPYGLVDEYAVPIATGDELCAINGVPLRNKNNEQIDNILRSSAQAHAGEIELLVRRGSVSSGTRSRPPPITACPSNGTRRQQSLSISSDDASEDAVDTYTTAGSSIAEDQSSSSHSTSMRRHVPLDQQGRSARARPEQIFSAPQRHPTSMPSSHYNNVMAHQRGFNEISLKRKESPTRRPYFNDHRKYTEGANRDLISPLARPQPRIDLELAPNVPSPPLSHRASSSSQRQPDPAYKYRHSSDEDSFDQINRTVSQRSVGHLHSSHSNLQITRSAPSPSLKPTTTSTLPVHELQNRRPSLSQFRNSPSLSSSSASSYQNLSQHVNGGAAVGSDETSTSSNVKITINDFERGNNINTFNLQRAPVPFDMSVFATPSDSSNEIHDISEDFSSDFANARHSITSDKKIGSKTSKDDMLDPMNSPALAKRSSSCFVNRKEQLLFGEIQLQLAHNEDEQQLVVKILQARNLIAKDANGFSDPYVKVYLLPGRDHDNKRRTKHILKSLNPVWNCTVTYPNVYREEVKNKTLEFTVWDWDRFKSNDFLGMVLIDLSDPSFLDDRPRWYPLKNNFGIKEEDDDDDSVKNVKTKKSTKSKS